MNVVDTAKAQVKQIVEKVSEKVADSATSESRIQAITIGRPRNEVVHRFGDAGFLSQVFGDVTDVHEAGQDRLRWTFRFDGNDGTTWDCVVAVEDDAIMRFVDVNPEKSAGIMVQFREAPQDRGTEVIARTTSPGPGALTGVLTFKEQAATPSRCGVRAASA